MFDKNYYENLQEQQSKIINKYPDMFTECSHLDIGIGWLPLVDKLCSDLQSITNTVKVAQCKEKFGGLRFYIFSVDESVHAQVYNLIDKAENESFKICEHCGQPGTVSKSSGWILTLCGDCDALRDAKC
jgi:hypothetical protein